MLDILTIPRGIEGPRVTALRSKLTARSKPRKAYILTPYDYPITFSVEDHYSFTMKAETEFSTAWLPI